MSLETWSERGSPSRHRQMWTTSGGPSQNKFAKCKHHTGPHVTVSASVDVNIPCRFGPRVTLLEFATSTTRNHQEATTNGSVGSASGGQRKFAL